MTKALVILSGGQDSTLCLWLAKRQFSEVSAITFNYGQRHIRELQAARDVAKLMQIADHKVVDVGPILESTSPLTDPSAQLEQYADFDTMDDIIGDRVEKTFVPMRNALFLTLAANRAVVMGSAALYTGVCEADNANYPDCRARFIKSQEKAINEALGYVYADDHYIKINTPLMYLSKAQSITLAIDSGAFTYLAFTHTAYDGAYPPVGQDHATVLRARGFVEAGVPDPLVLRACKDDLMDLPTSPNYNHSSLNNRIYASIERMQNLLAEGVAI